MDETWSVRRLGVDDQRSVLEYLRVAPDRNLTLIDYAGRLGRPPGQADLPPQLFGAYQADRLMGVAAVRPSVVVSAALPDAARDALLPQLLRVPSGLVKCDRRDAEPIWAALAREGRRTSIDRVEIAYRLRPEEMRPVQPPLPGVARPARESDLAELVYAARASLWEEDRPDPAEGDPKGFERWVRSRMERARVVCEGGRLVFVAYADVRCDEGWLVQGVYTWPKYRRRGYARRGMDSVLREAFASGASHVQLAVVEGNDRAARLYEALGFEAFAELRTVLFH